ncbi:MAG: adenylate/guanylate cyclase domain-containing protein, partial [Tepidisphaeraceae bacterium]
NHRLFAQHHSMSEVWDVCAIGPEIEDNNREAMKDIVSLTQSDDILKQHPPFGDVTAWNKLMADTIGQLTPDFTDVYKPYLDGKADPQTLTDPRDRQIFSAYRSLLVTRPASNSLLEQVRNARRKSLREQLFGKAVLVGWTATGFLDRADTPLGSQEFPGVVVHGAVFNAIMTGDFIRPAPLWTGLAITMLVGALATFAGAYLSPIRALTAAAAIVVIYLICNFFFIYDWGRIEMDAAGPVAAAVLTLAGCTLARFIVERREKAHITARFRSYVDPSLVNYLLEHPEKATLAGEQRELTVVFTDLAGFTTLSEVLKEETVKLLNEYLGRMEPVIRRNHGYLNKFLGDGIMFFFGAPEPYPGDPDLHAWAAVQTVVEMQAVMVSFNEDLVKRGLPELKMRAGVSTGMVTVGDAGTPARSDYTVIGDRANLASRLESGNKATGTLILLSDRTVELMNGRYLVRPIGRLQVVGKKEPVMTYEPLAPMEKATDEMRKLVAMTKAVTDSYIAGQFAECVAATHQLLTTYGDASQGKLCALYRRLSMEYLRIPPREFLGEIKLESK